ncbi:MAG TPA: ABC transporter permease [Candidatus Dormibacteraeota bacterium]|nr:ABC transporter permease [Candidatus Dormibacteraeota bacterium]
MTGGPSEVAIFFRSVVARAYPRVVGANRQKSWIFFDMAFPMIGTLAMVFVYEGLHAPHQYLGFVVMGGGMLAFWQNVLWSMAAQFSWDRDNGTLELYAVSPTTFESILLGMAVGAMFTTSMRAGAVILIGSLLFSVTYNLSGLLPAAGIFLLTLSALYCLGMLLASLFLYYSREAWHLSNALQEPVNFLSGLYFPVKALGAYVGGAASLVPLTLGLDAMRQLLLPQTPRFLAPGWEALVVALQIPVFGFLAYTSLRRMEGRARAEGRLISKWS